MANTIRNTEMSSVDGSGSASDATQCGAHELKGLLNSLVNQIGDADRRHSEALHSMQERLASLGREAQSLKDRVPDRFLSAFERIEAGMADLAANITGPHDDSVMPIPSADTAPVPLRSKSDLGQGSAATPRSPRSDDTFDIVELSSPPLRSHGDESDLDEPWDQNSADALAGLYETAPSQFTAQQTAAGVQKPAALSSGFDIDMSLMSSVSPVHSGTGMVQGGSADHAWFEARFAEITRRIDESLADIRPDQSFFAIGQRLDSVEQSLAQVVEATAIRPDSENIRVIETHLAELAGHLENTYTQLGRLDAIEGYLGEINTRLSDVHQMAMASTDGAVDGSGANAGFDAHAIARAAVDEATQKFASLVPLQPSGSGDEMRPLIERFMSESRQGEENTHALLDTLQQAMIRLLDRVDTLEFSQHQPAIADIPPSAMYAPEPIAEPRRSYANVDAPALDAAVAAVATQRTFDTSAPIDDARQETQQPVNRPVRERAPVAAMGVENGSGSGSVRSTQQLRNDFIADARRAKQRLSTAGDMSLDVGPDRVETPESSASAIGARIKSAVKGANGAKGSAATASQPASAARLAVMAVATLGIVAGGWYVLDTSRRGSREPAPIALDAPAKATKPASAAATPQVMPGKPKPAVQPDTEKLRMPDGTRGEIIPDNLTVGSAQVPLHGVAVDMPDNVNANDFERSQRRQQLATLSNKVGSAAAVINNGIATPMSLIPGRDEAESVISNNEGVAKAAPALATMQDLASIGGRQSGAIDMPPASVGPLSLRMAAANGDPSAEFDVGARLAEGRGGSQNFKDAAKWYQRSADRGFAQAQYRLGTLYERGLGLKSDPARAREWYQRAAEAGNVKAMHNLAVMSANQAGGSPDYASAAEWFTKAAEYGLADSQFNLAVLYENGLGVEQDLAQSLKWLTLAAKAGDAEAIRRRDNMRGKLTVEQARQADALIASWKSKLTEPLVNDARAASDAWKRNPQNGVNG